MYVRINQVIKIHSITSNHTNIAGKAAVAGCELWFSYSRTLAAKLLKLQNELKKNLGIQ